MWSCHYLFASLLLQVGPLSKLQVLHTANTTHAKPIPAPFQVFRMHNQSEHISPDLSQHPSEKIASPISTLHHFCVFLSTLPPPFLHPSTLQAAVVGFRDRLLEDQFNDRFQLSTAMHLRAALAPPMNAKASRAARLHRLKARIAVRKSTPECRSRPFFRPRSACSPSLIRV